MNAVVSLATLSALLLPNIAFAHPGHPEAALGVMHLHGLGEMVLGMAVIAGIWIVKRQGAKAKAKAAK